MSQKVNRERLKFKMGSPVWKIKVGVYSQVSEKSIKRLEEAKYWKIKVILN